MPSKGPTQRERFEKEREEWSQRNRTMQFGSKELKEVLCNNMTAVGSLFQIWDENGDGVITRDEFAHAVKVLDVPVPPEVSYAVFQEFDHDGSGTVSSAEFLRFALRDKLARSAARVMTFFKHMDADGSGEVAVDEFRDAIASLGIDIPREHADAVFAIMDTDGSGTLSFKELHRQLRQGASVKLSKRLKAGGAGHVRLSAKERFTVDPYAQKGPAASRNRSAATPGARPRPETAPMPSQLSELMRPPNPALAATAGGAAHFIPALSINTPMARQPSMLTISEGGMSGIGEIRFAHNGSIAGRPYMAPGTSVRPGGGGAPRTPDGRFYGFAAKGLVVCDEKRRRSIQDEKSAIAAQQPRGPERWFKQTTVSGYSGPRWTEPLPSIDPHSGFPLITPSALRYQMGEPTKRSQYFTKSR